jgi:hypothetical protein
MSHERTGCYMYIYWVMHMYIVKLVKGRANWMAALEVVTVDGLKLPIYLSILHSYLCEALDSFLRKPSEFRQTKYYEFSKYESMYFTY